MSAANEALWLTSRRGTLRVGPAPDPVPGPGQVVVEAGAVALNPVDAVPGLARTFVYPWLRLPTVLGTDVAGTVVATGPGVTRYAVGARVVGFATGQEKAWNDPARGAFQRLVLLDADLTAPVPDAIDLAQAAVLPLALLTAAAGLFEPDQLGLALPGAVPAPDGGTVLVWGGSTSVGTNAVQLAVAAGHRVVATASAHNHELLHELGAAATVDYHRPDAVDEVVRAVGPGPLVGTVAIGRGSLQAAVGVARRCAGSRRVASSAPGPVTALRARLARRHGVRVSAIWGGTPAQDGIGPALFGEFLPAALAEGRYRPAPTAEVEGHDLTAVPAGLARLRRGVSARKLVVELTQGGPGPAPQTEVARPRPTER